jgi:hypothetical protein
MIVTDDYCQSAATDIMNIVENFGLTIEDDLWIEVYDKIFDLLIDKFESNGYVNHN